MNGISEKAANLIRPILPGKTILLVEDEEAVAAVEQQLLERIGWQVLTATCGQEALAYLRDRQRQFTMVLMDMDLPDISGSQLFEEICRIRPDLKVIICSGNAQADEVQELVADGALGFLQKPFGIKSLQKALVGVAPLEMETA
ncbi:MAG: response regulator [Desulfobacterales bacterium]|nr:response regulator [Desulfobacterales bacterium]